MDHRQMGAMLNVDLLVRSAPAIAHAATITIGLTAAASAVSVTAGALSVAVQTSGGRIGYWLSRSYVSLMRGTPLYVQLLVVYFGLASAGLAAQSFLAAALAIGLNSGAYTTEIFRAGLAVVPRGQIEACEAIGMHPVRVWTRLLFPQAVIASLPSLTAELTLVLKSTPLASVLAVTEMTYAGVLIQTRTYSAIEVFTLVSVGYIAMTQVLLRLSAFLERRFQRYRG